MSLGVSDFMMLGVAARAVGPNETMPVDWMGEWTDAGAAFAWGGPGAVALQAGACGNASATTHLGWQPSGWLTVEADVAMDVDAGAAGTVSVSVAGLGEDGVQVPFGGGGAVRMFVSDGPTSLSLTVAGSCEGEGWTRVLAANVRYAFEASAEYDYVVVRTSYTDCL